MFRRLSVFFFIAAQFGSTLPARASEPTAAEPVCVKAEKARLRAGPSTNARITWNVGRFMPLERVGRQAEWSQVRDFRGEKHWVISTNLTTDESCAVIKVKAASLRQGPGSQFPKADFQVADRYTPFKKVDREGEWVKLEDDFKGSYWTLDSNVWMPVKRTQISF